MYCKTAPTRVIFLLAMMNSVLWPVKKQNIRLVKIHNEVWMGDG